MNALYLDWPCFGQVDLIFSLEHEFGYHVTKFFHKDYQERESKTFSEEFDKIYQTTSFDFTTFTPFLRNAAIKKI